MPDAPIFERASARLLLLDPQNRILLVQGRRVFGPDRSIFWYTIGGGVEAGESLEAAAAREGREETGLSDIEIGPHVWYRETHDVGRENRHIFSKENYFLARCAGGEPNRDGWLPEEHESNFDLRWWSLDEIAASSETFVPPNFAALMRDLLRDGPPVTPITLKS